MSTAEVFALRIGLTNYVNLVLMTTFDLTPLGFTVGSNGPVRIVIGPGEPGHLVRETADWRGDSNSNPCGATTFSHSPTGALRSWRIERDPQTGLETTNGTLKKVGWHQRTISWVYPVAKKGSLKGTRAKPGGRVDRDSSNPSSLGTKGT